MNFGPRHPSGYNGRMDEKPVQFGLRQLFHCVAIIALACGVIAGLIRAAQIADRGAQRNVYGGMRYTRAEAEAAANRTFDFLSDDEFKDSR